MEMNRCREVVAWPGMPTSGGSLALEYWLAFDNTRFLVASASMRARSDSSALISAATLFASELRS